MVTVRLPRGRVKVSDSMANTSEQLERRLSELIEVTERVRTTLQRYNEASASVAERIGQGDDLVGTLESLHGPVRRSEVTEVMEDFERSRHRVRLAMFALAKEQGANVSDMARALGISRQLAARLATEALETLE